MQKSSTLHLIPHCAYSMLGNRTFSSSVCQRWQRHTLLQFLVCALACAKRSSRTPKIIYRIVSNCKCVWLLALALFCLYLISVFNFQSFIPIRFRINIPLILYNKMLVFLKSSTFTLSRLP